MTNLYLFSLVSGGIVLLASIVVGDRHINSGGGHTGTEQHGAGPTPFANQSRVASRRNAFWALLAALRSLRFWTFALTFFGLTGLVLSDLGLLCDERRVTLLALAVGLVAGLLAILMIRRLAASETNSASDERDFVGKVGRVLVPISTETLGKIRISLRSGAVDVLASTDETEPFTVGEAALIIHMNDTTAVVVRPARDPQ